MAMPDGTSRVRRLRTAPPAPATPASSFRRSRFVALMKVLLPIAALGLLVVITAWPALNPSDDRFQLGLAMVRPPKAENPEMLNPRMVGVDTGQRPFSVTASLGTRVSEEGEPEVFALSEPKADITLTDGTWVALAARDGTYRRDEQVLDLAGDVDLFHDSGYEFRTSAARIFLTTREASGDAPIEGQGPFGLLEAEGFRVLDQGGRIVFTGRAKLTLFEGATGGQR